MCSDWIGLQRTQKIVFTKTCSCFEASSGKAGRRPHIWKSTGAHAENKNWTRNAMTGNSPHILDIVRKIEFHIINLGLDNDLCANICAPSQEIRKCHACHAKDTSWQSDGLPKDLRVRMLSISRGVPRLPRQSASPAIGRTGHKLAGHLARTQPGAQEVARLPRQIVSAVGWTGQRPH